MRLCSRIMEMAAEANSMPAGSLVLGIDLGATNARVALVAADGAVAHRTAIPSEPHRGPEDTVERICRAAVRLMAHAGTGAKEIRGAGIASAGEVDLGRDVLLHWPNVPAWRDVPLPRMFAKSLGLPCTIENDGNAAALAEHWIGVGRGLSSLVLLTLGTGIGGGIVLDGRLWRGASGAAGEIGHMSIDPEGPKCICGNRGCLQAYAGAAAMVGRMRAALAAGEPSTLAACRQELSAELIHRAALAGDEAARRNIRATGRYLGVGVAGILRVLNPEVVALSGGVTAAGPMLMEPLRAEVQRRTPEADRPRVRLAFSSVPQDAGVIGAARAFMLDQPGRQALP